MQPVVVPSSPHPGVPLAPLIRPVTVTSSGRDALGRILTYLRLQPDDEIWISTTLGMCGLHISPCVTGTVAHHCRFAFQPGTRTAAALVIHDYGVPHPALTAIRERCRRHGWPLIEDAAHAFASTDAGGQRLGMLADFALFSLPKFFALQHGGLVVGLPKQAAGPEDPIVAAQWSSVAPHAAAIAEMRRQNWLNLDRHLRTLGLGSALPLTAGSVPSLYLLQTQRQFGTLRRLRRAGIESGPDVHCGRVFLPCHQQVGPADVRRIAALVGANGAPDAPLEPESVPPRPSPRLRLTAQ